MTSNVGTEYINLKKAKYNRDMREKRVTKASEPLSVQKTPMNAASALTQRQTHPVKTTHAPAYAAPHTAHSAYAPSYG